MTKLNEKPILTKLTNYGLIKISGPDSAKLLQGQITCDVNKAENTSIRGAHCNPQGRIVCLFELVKRNDDYYLVLPNSMVQITLTALKKYALFYKTKLTAVSDFFIVGFNGAIPTTTQISKLSIVNIDDTRNMIIGQLASFNECWETLAETALSVDEIHWKAIDIQHKRVQIYEQTSAQLLPHEVNLQKTPAIDFNKGCYTGQEIIARMQYKAKLKKGLHRATINSPSSLNPGEPIYVMIENKPANVGVIIDSYSQGYDNYEALIVVENAHAQNNSLFLTDAEQSYFRLIN